MPLFWGELGPHLTQSRLGEAYLHAKYHLDLSSRLATINIGRKKIGAAPLFGEGLGPHLTQTRMGRGLPQYQVAS